MNGPEDVSGLKGKIEDAEIKAKNIAAIMCMTEGDNFARGFATMAFSHMLSKKLGVPQEEVANRIPMLMIGGVAV